MTSILRRILGRHRPALEAQPALPLQTVDPCLFLAEVSQVWASVRSGKIHNPSGVPRCVVLVPLDDHTIRVTDYSRC
jgi:hypothetical protein